MDLTRFVQIARIHWQAILVCMMLGGLGASSWVLLTPKTYTATSAGILQSTTGAQSSTISGDQVVLSRAATYVTAAKSRSVAEAVIVQLHLDVSPADLVQSIRITNPPDSAVIQVSAEAATPQDARRLADAWVNAVADSIAQLQSEAGGVVAVRLYPTEPADLPTAPTSPKATLIVLLGLVAGGVAGIGYGLASAVLDTRVRDADEIESRAGLPLLGRIPAVKGLTSRRGLIDADAAPGAWALAGEALRTVRTNLQFMNVDDPPRVLVMTSPLPGEGKSMISANLAVAIADNGSRVVLVDGDLRRPTVAKTFDLVDGAGLTDVLAGRVGVGDVLQSWAGNENLRILAAGTIPPNPSELVGSRSMDQLMHRLAEDSFVVIDAPPILSVTDAAVMGARADGVLLVLAWGSTSWSGLDQARSAVARAGGRIVGAVLNKIPINGPASYSYGYHSGYHNYSYESERSVDPRHAARIKHG